MSTNVITRLLEGWFSQTHQVENNDNKILDVFFFSIRRPNRKPQELKCFKLAGLFKYACHFVTTSIKG